MDENSGSTVRDSSGYDNDGEWPSSRVNWVQGKYGSALEFDGVDDYVEVEDKSGLDGMSELTVMAWVWYESSTGAGIVNKFTAFTGTTVDDSYRFHINESGNIVFQYIVNNTLVSKTSDVIVSKKRWHFVTCIYDGVEGKLLLGGEEVPLSQNTSDLGGAINECDTPMYIGCLLKNTGLYGFADGIIDDVRIYNRALSAEEVQWLMHTRPDIGDPNLVGYWGFDEGEGQVAGDYAVYGNDGQLGSTPDEDNNDPVWVASDAPVGICSLEGIVERNLSDVWDTKVSILEQLYEVIAKEQALLDYMDEKFADRDFGDTSKGDIAKAKQKIMGAIQQETKAQTAVDQSLDKIDAAMDTLGIESNTDGEPVE